MPLFLSEDTMLRYLLTEAGDEPNDNNEQDLRAEEADAAEDGEEAAPPGDGEGDGSEGVESPDDQPEAKVPRKRAPSRFAIKVEDTPQNRVFLYEKFEELVTIHKSVRQFLETILEKGNITSAQRSLLMRLALKIDTNVEFLDRLQADDLVAEMDISNVFGLYKIYYGDANNANTMIKAIMSIAPPSNKNR